MLPLNKVLGTDNIADLMTKNLTAAVIDRYVGMMGMRFAEGRSKIAQELHSVERIDLNPPATPESQSTASSTAHLQSREAVRKG